MNSDAVQQRGRYTVQRSGNIRKRKSAQAVGDRWALLILRDIVIRGKRTCGEFLQSEERFATKSNCYLTSKSDLV